jgi:hypothetical protein
LLNRAFRIRTIDGRVTQRPTTSRRPNGLRLRFRIRDGADIVSQACRTSSSDHGNRRRHVPAGPILNSEFRGDGPEPCSATAASELEMLVIYHEGPTTRAAHGEARSPRHQEKIMSTRGRHKGHPDTYCLFSEKSIGPNLEIDCFWILDRRNRGEPKILCAIRVTRLPRGGV